MCPEFNSFSHKFNFPSCKAGDQKWKGAALTLNKNPIEIINKQLLTYTAIKFYMQINKALLRSIERKLTFSFFHSGFYFFNLVQPFFLTPLLLPNLRLGSQRGVKMSFMFHQFCYLTKIFKI